jgi:hypothetical protein
MRAVSPHVQNVIITARMHSIFLVPPSIYRYGDYLFIRLCVYYTDPVIFSAYPRIFLSKEHNSAPIFVYQRNGTSYSIYFDCAAGYKVIVGSHK